MLSYSNNEDYSMDTITTISTNAAVALKNGPVQFGDDWPGTFLTISYVKKHIHPADEINPATVLDADAFSKMYLYSVYNNLCSNVHNPIYDNVPAEDDVEDTVQLVTDPIIKSDNKVVNRVETGFVEVNGQHGYFVRGDNSAYIVYTLTLRTTLTEEETAFRDLLSKCIVGGFKFTT